MSRALAQYLYAQLVVPIGCQYVGLVEAGEWVDPVEWGSCKHPEHTPFHRCLAVDLVCEAARTSAGCAIGENACMHVRCLDGSRMLWLAVGVPHEADGVLTAEILDLIAPLLTFYVRLATTKVRRPSPSSGKSSTLSEGQHDILVLIADGLTNPSIARRIGFSESLVRHEIMAIFKIFGIHTRADALAMARSQGLLALPLSS